MMMIGSDDRVRVKIVLYGINSKMADVSLTSLLLAAPYIYIVADSGVFGQVRQSLTVWVFAPYSRQPNVIDSAPP